MPPPTFSRSCEREPRLPPQISHENDEGLPTVTQKRHHNHSTLRAKLPALKCGASIVQCRNHFLPLDGGGLRWGWCPCSSPSPSPSHPRLKERDLRQEGEFKRMPFIPVLKGGAFWHIFVNLSFDYSYSIFGRTTKYCFNC